MNIFFLDENPVIAASYHCDKHVVKMILETGQLLSTAHRLLDGDQQTILTKRGRKKKIWVHSENLFENSLYSATHVNHPSAVWARQSHANYDWLYQLMLALNEECKRRFKHDRNHLTVTKLRDLLKYKPQHIQSLPFIEPPLCMSDECKTEDAVESYKNYYNLHKRDISRWRTGEIPEWFAPDVENSAARIALFSRKSSRKSPTL